LSILLPGKHIPANARACVSPLTDRPCHAWRYAIDAGRIEQELDLSPAQDFACGLLRALTCILDNKTWWRGRREPLYRDWMEMPYETCALIGSGMIIYTCIIPAFDNLPASSLL